jgi:hypothetical protein
VNIVHGSGPSDVYAARSDSGEIPHFDGSAWQLIRSEVKQFKDIWASSATDAYAVGVGSDAYNLGMGPRWSALWHFDGETWTRENPGVGCHELNAVWTADPDNVFVTGNDGLILRYPCKTKR